MVIIIFIIIIIQYAAIITTRLKVICLILVCQLNITKKIFHFFHSQTTTAQSYEV